MNSTVRIDELQARLRLQLHGQVQELRLLFRENGLVLHGSARTYYAKQLAQHVALETSGLSILINEIRVC